MKRRSNGRKGVSCRSIAWPRRRIDVRLNIDPEDRQRLRGSDLGEKHMRTTYYIVRRFADIVGDMTEDGERDATIVVAAQDIIVNILTVALQAIVARHGLPYDKAPEFVDGVLDDLMPATDTMVRQRLQAWIMTSQVLLGKKDKGDRT